VIANNICPAAVPVGSTCTYAVQNLLTMPVSGNGVGFGGVTGQTFIEYTSTSGMTFQTSNILSSGSSFLLPGTATDLNVLPDGTITFPANQVGYAQTSSIQLATVGYQIVNGQQQGLIITGSPAATFSIGGANPGDFSVSAVTTSVSPNPASSCPGGTSACIITVTFTPTAVGTPTAKISLNTGSSPTGEYILVTGTAVGPGPSFTTNPTALPLTSHLPSNIDPASVGKGTVTVTNTGTTTLTLAATFAGPNPSRFTADVSQCRSVAPQATCSVPVSFSAPIGSYGATLVLTDASSGTTATAVLSGTSSYWIPNVFSSTSIAGPPPIAIVFPTQAVSTTSAPQTFSVADQNQYPIGDPITVSLQTNSSFILPSGSTCPTGNQPCTLSIEFAPQATGSFRESLTLTDPVTGATNTVLIFGAAQ